MAERAERFAAALREGESLDVAEAMMRLTFEIVGKTLFDTEVVSDAGAVGDALTTAMEVAMGQLGSVVPLPPMIPSPQNLRYKRAVARLDDVVYRIIRDRRAEGGDRGDVLSMLLDARDEEGAAMTDRQVRDEAMTLVIAGHETTANALAWTFYLLARHPEVRARMESELDALGHAPTYDDLKTLPYTLAVFKEAMRLYPPAYILGRRLDRGHRRLASTWCGETRSSSSASSASTGGRTSGPIRRGSSRSASSVTRRSSSRAARTCPSGRGRASASATTSR